MSEDNKEVKPEDNTFGQESSPDDKKEPVGEQPVTKEQLDALQKQIAGFEKKANEYEKRTKHAEEIAQNMQNALKVEREKRKETKKQSKFDPEEMANFKEALKESGTLTKEDLESFEKKKSQEKETQKNTKVFQGFIAKNKEIFGATAEDATEEQNKNLKVFGSYLDEYFDVNVKTLGATKNLEKKLKKALNDLRGQATASVAKAKGADETLARQKDNILLSVGTGGEASVKDDNWGYKTPKAEAMARLRAIGYTAEEIKEMVSRPKK